MRQRKGVIKINYCVARRTTPARHTHDLVVFTLKGESIDLRAASSE